MNFFRKTVLLWVDALVLLLIYLYLFHHIPLQFLFEDTVITGGDTGSHYKTAAYLKEILLPQGKVIGWYPGNYGGYPLFIMYFPLLYLVAVGLSEWMALTVSFKIVTLLGPLLLPICTYAMVRCCRFRFPGPGLAACGSILFLFDTSHSMWGGNMYSTLAGEFSYAVSFSLTFAFLGVLYRLVEQVQDDKQKLKWSWVLMAVLLLVLIGLSHGFTLIICSLTAFYFLLTPRYFTRKAVLIVTIFGLGGLLFSGWFMQLFFNTPYTTAFNILWTFGSIREVLPPALLPPIFLFLVYSFYALVPQSSPWQWLSWQERRIVPFLWFIIVLCTLSYFSSETLKLPDIRFIPFIHFLATIWGCALIGVFFKNPFVQKVVPLMGFCLMVLWLSQHSHNSKGWMFWNFRGFENAPRWPAHESVIYSLAGRYGDPRVAYEHNQINNGLGTVRAFESLPYFAGRATLEGLYFQSSLLSPFVFYVQSLYSKEISCPFPDYPCSRFDLERAAPYLELLNTNQLILLSDEAKSRARELGGSYQFQKKIKYSPYELWGMDHPTGYVTVLDQAPEFVKADNFRHTFYHWFREYNKERPFLYTLPQIYQSIYGLDQIPPQAPVVDVSSEACRVEEHVKKESIRFKTNCLGQPHLVKVAYNPGWQVEGAVGPYLISPAFMLVYPESPEVTLYFDNRGPRQIGLTMTAVGVGLLALLLILTFVPALRQGIWIHSQTLMDQKLLNRVGYGLFLILFLGFIAIVGKGLVEPGYHAMFKQYERYYTAKDYKTAQMGFEKVIEQWKDQPTIDRVYYFLGLAYYLDNQCDRASDAFKGILNYRGSEYLAESYYHLGICANRLNQKEEAQQYYQKIIDELQDPIWSRHAKARLKESGL